MKRIRNWYHSLKLRKKALVLYFFCGVCLLIPLTFFAGMFLRNYLKREETDSLSHSLTQAVQQMESDLTLYNALSNYIINNNDLANVLNRSYGSGDYFAMYLSLENTILPSLRIYQLLNPDIAAINIYTDCGFPAYKKYIYPLEDLKEEEWFSQIENRYTVVWLADSSGESPRILSARRLLSGYPRRQNNYLVISIDYYDFFQPFLSTLSPGDGIRVRDGSGEVIYGLHMLDDGMTETFLADPEEDGEEFLTVTDSLGNGWEAVLCRPVSSFDKSIFPVILVLWLVMFLVVLTLLICIYFISGTLIRPIERLSDEVQAMTAASSRELLAETRTDEIGVLIRNFNRMIREVYANQLQANEYRLKALYSQINPHFLYNSLGLINNKAILAGQDEISRMTLLLSQFYRTSLNQGKDLTTIGNELKNVRMYIEIQNILYSNRFEVLYQIDESLLDVTMPNFILQPIIENAIEHGLRNDKKPHRRLWISLEACGSDAVFRIQDNGVGMTPEELAGLNAHETAGVGLSNIDNRLRLCYGDDYGLRIESRKNEGTTVTVRICREKIFMT